ncbi:hypothetical protein HMPREF0758_1289 [Serratia odorifera DSM 4582]|uniref:Uncharacterized protein n=1 Tax=Serratia odorifera DSM 4582 TaxID=667129 RepID=D4DZD9_SEROD|nr:hypothetical protein HMPREF0758_1289 [Serratia odorifera DSM 4582]
MNGQMFFHHSLLMVFCLNQLKQKEKSKFKTGEGYLMKKSLLKLPSIMNGHYHHGYLG